MKTRSLLEICNNVATQLRFETFTNVIGNTSRNAQLVLLAVRQGLERDVFWHHPWAILRRTAYISFSANKSYYILAPDFDHVVNDTAWDIISKSPAVGPLDPVQWASVLAQQEPFGTVTFTIRGYEPATIVPAPGPNPGNQDPALTGGARGTGNSKTPYQLAVFIYPAPEANSAGPALMFEYISNECIVGTNGAAKTKFTADADVPVLDADLVEHAGYVRALRMLGLQFADEASELQEAMRVVSRRDGGYVRMQGHREARAYSLNTPNHYPVR